MGSEVYPSKSKNTSYQRLSLPISYQSVLGYKVSGLSSPVPTSQDPRAWLRSKSSSEHACPLVGPDSKAT